MYKKPACLLRIPLFTTLFILVMIQRVTTVPDKFKYPYYTNRYGDVNKEQEQKNYDSISFGLSDVTSISSYNSKIASTTQKRMPDNTNFSQRTQFADQKRNPDPNSRIVFPTDDLVTSTNRFTTVPSCEGTLCENVTYYPEIEIKNLVGQSGNVKFIGGTDSLKLDIAQRVDFTGESSLCDSDERVMFPKTGLNENKQWFFIVNVENFTQGVRVETCRNEGNECNYISNDVVEGYKTVCKQNYIVQTLAAYAHDGKSITHQSFQLPSSCCCHVKFLGNDRMG